jgi:hypothetical protein
MFGFTQRGLKFSVMNIDGQMLYFTSFAIMKNPLLLSDVDQN